MPGSNRRPTPPAATPVEDPAAGPRQEDLTLEQLYEIIESGFAPLSAIEEAFILSLTLAASMGGGKPEAVGAAGAGAGAR